MNLNQVKAVISGGASGLGHATAARLVAAGAQVALLDVQDDAGRKAAIEVLNQSGMVTSVLPEQ